MTEPTAKPTVKSNNSQGASASATNKANINKNDNKGKAKNIQHKSKNKQKDSITATFDKATLLALFTLPSSDAAFSETAAFEKLSVEPSNLSTASQIPAKQSLNIAASDTNIAAQRVALYHTQHERTRQLYMASAATRPTYLVQTLKTQFAEYQQYLLAQQLDKRGLMDTDLLERLWQQLHVVDDIIEDIVRHMPAQQPAGWQLSTQDGHNPLCFATIGKLKHDKPIHDQGSLNSYVLGHFGVSSFTYDRGYYIGHVVGYLFSCYFCAHLSISYGVTALGQQVVSDYGYASLETPHMVRLLQGLDSYCKKRIYQLAVSCARLSVFASDKRIERMLIAEVNDFDKKLQQQHLDVLLLQGLMPDSNDSTPLF
ncbi:hypothetical protein [Psychrobacter sp. DAB_AL32B]|uniref:hypothetical protein n=1 Tax=Psychrobacter sp. DAB_AL32B TaxID=1028414 RepID=UPI000B7D9131|nr:hypothetical protein [Psychrobacter sp. DAB_AL32B]OXL24219.1 hypothetical protein CAN34_05860 [Psychrobacter sp. DAB_AL32B]